MTMRLTGWDRDRPSSSGPTRGIPRVSLVHGRTGVPLFVLFLKSVSQPGHRELRSLEQVERLRDPSGHQGDMEAWRLIEAFFVAGGTSAHVLILPFPEEGGRLRAMLGTDRGISRRTGIQCVREWAERADLLSIPQATELLDLEGAELFIASVLDLVSSIPGMLYLADLPKACDETAALKMTRPLFCSDAAVFHPWLLNGEQALPPSIGVAAWLQRADQEVGIQEIAGDSPLGGGLVPLRDLSGAVRGRLLEGRINTFLNHLGQARVWGGYTLADSADWRTRLIPLRRSSVKLQQAAEEICEPFVLEAAGPELPVAVENRLQGFLRSVRPMFHRDLQEPFATSVRIVEQDGEERIQVGLNYTLPHSLEKFSLSFVA